MKIPWGVLYILYSLENTPSFRSRFLQPRDQLILPLVKKNVCKCLPIAPLVDGIGMGPKG
jgi:hypothetical protein